ncbi:MAG TPA: hypothetical protein VMF30_09495 [Pirellulales bacterium]|nr:hypothetical protein [Pirellulales bacterium]
MSDIRVGSNGRSIVSGRLHALVAVDMPLGRDHAILLPGNYWALAVSLSCGDAVNRGVLDTR